MRVGITGERVSAARAIRKGGEVLCHQGTLLAIMAFAVVCERSFSWYLAATGTSLAAYALQYQALLLALANHPVLDPSQAKASAGLFKLAGLSGILLLFGGFLSMGVISLLRDLFLRDRYNAAILLPQAAHFFWPIVRFKLPIYLGLTGWCFLLLPLLLPVLIDPMRQFFTSRTAWVGLAMGLPLLVMRIPLSLGPKWIIARDVRRIRVLYGAVWRLIGTHWCATVGYYSVTLMLAAMAAAFPVLLARVGLPRWWILILTTASSTALALWAKASSLSFYLQLAAAAEEQEREKTGQPIPHEVKRAGGNS